jgi:hypothetical protein
VSQVVSGRLSLPVVVGRTAKAGNGAHREPFLLLVFASADTPRPPSYSARSHPGWPLEGAACSCAVIFPICLDPGSSNVETMSIGSKMCDAEAAVLVCHPDPSRLPS